MPLATSFTSCVLPRVSHLATSFTSCILPRVSHLATSFTSCQEFHILPRPSASPDHFISTVITDTHPSPAQKKVHPSRTKDLTPSIAPSTLPRPSRYPPFHTNTNTHIHTQTRRRTHAQPSSTLPLPKKERKGERKKVKCCVG